MAEKYFNNGEFLPKQMDMHKLAKYMFSDSSESIMTVPDVTNARNLGTNAYRKPGLGLTLLREQILGEGRFDSAFMYYTHQWAFKHPTPWDFFHAIENYSGETLDWFWRGWFLDNWKIDQAVKGVDYIQNDPSKGSFITIANMQQLPMPVTIEIKQANGTTERVHLPVEIWQHGGVWKFKYNSTDKITSVVIDPDKKIPDVNDANNSWSQNL
jgi:hypothetical protein